MTSNKVGVKKILSTIGTCLTIILVVLALFIIVNTVVAKVKNQPISYFGYSFAIVQTGSMEPEIKIGDLIVYKSCDIADLAVGDNIVFTAGSGFSQEVRGQNIIHKVYAIENGQITTYGIHNGYTDSDKVTADNLVGICTYHSTFWGGVFSFIKSYGILLLIAIVAVPFIISQIIRIVKLSKEKEQ